MVFKEWYLRVLLFYSASSQLKYAFFFNNGQLSSPTRMTLTRTHLILSVLGLSKILLWSFLLLRSGVFSPIPFVKRLLSLS